MDSQKLLNVDNRCVSFYYQILFFFRLVEQELSSCWDGRPFGHNRHGPRFIRRRLACVCKRWKKGAAVPLSVEWNGSPSNTVWPGPMPTSVPSGSLIQLTFWPQYTNVTDRQTGHSQRSDSIGRIVLQTVAPKLFDSNS